MDRGQTKKSEYSLIRMPSASFSFYYLEGDDESIVSSCASEIKSLYPEASLSDFNYDRLEGGRGFKSYMAEESLSILPFMSPFRIVEICSFQLIPADEKEKLAAFIAGGLGKSVLIALAGPLSGRASAAQKKSECMLKSLGAFVDCRVNERNWDAWVRKLLQRHSIEIDYAALRVLKERLGGDFGMTLQELKKLESYSFGKRRITAADVKDISALSREAQIFRLSDCITRGNASAALQAFYSLSGSSGQSVTILLYLRRYFAGIASVRESFSKTGSVEETAKVLKKHEYVVQKSLDACENISDKDFARISDLLMRADLDFKESLNASLVFESLIIRLSSMFRKRSF